ncbi:class I adenylate-forming enzyme family protein [Chloroflexota bacterium]
MQNLRLLLENTAGKFPDKTALKSVAGNLSYQELNAASNQVARGLLSLGIRHGDRVAMLLPNIIEFVVFYFGIAKMGAVVAPLDMRYKTEELQQIFQSCQPKAVVAGPEFLAGFNPETFPSVRQTIVIGENTGEYTTSYAEMLNSFPEDGIGIGIIPEDLATITYASSPTTNPCGSTFTHSTLCREAEVSSLGLEQTEDDITPLFALPMFHNFGLATVMMNTIYKGSTLIIVPGTGISIHTLLDTIEQEKCTVLFGVPYIYALAVKMAKREGVHHDLSSLHLCCSGGAPLAVKVIKEFKQYYGINLADIWGLTEGVSAVTTQLSDGSGRIGSVGKALPGWKVAIVNADNKQLPPNHTGEIVIQGPMTSGYYQHPQETAKLIQNGWLHTGDLGKLNEDGFLFLTGRKKNMIILKGQNIYPVDIEQVLVEHPMVAAARVSGIPDKLRGEIVRATIQLKPDSEINEHEIRQYCLQRMADYKSPRQVVFQEKPLPKTNAEHRGVHTLVNRLKSGVIPPHQHKSKP